jgi:hypothetical protein
MGARTISHGAVSIEAPDGWVDASQLIALGPDSGGYRPSLVVSVQHGLRDDADAQSFAEGLTATLRAMLKGYVLVNEDEVTYGPWTGHLREHTFTHATLQLRQLQFHVVREGTGYVFSFTHRADEEDARDLAGTLFEQIQFGPSAPAEESDEPAELAAFRTRPSIGG